MKIHSYVGQITNSSTQIYSQVSNIGVIKNFIDQILQDVGIDKKADDLYTFTIDGGGQLYDQYVDENWEKFKDLSWSERLVEAKKEISLEELIEKYDQDGSDMLCDTYLVITTKDGEQRISNFNDIYHTFESFDD